jgi:hypothetical protein
MELVNLLWACGRLGEAPTDLVVTVLQAMGQHLGAFRTQDFAKTLWALGRLGLRAVDVPSDSDDVPARLLTRLATAAQPQLRAFGAQDLANTLWGMSAIGFAGPPGFLPAVVDAMRAKVHLFDPKEFTMAAVALARLEHYDGPILNQIAQVREGVLAGGCDSRRHA